MEHYPVAPQPAPAPNPGNMHYNPAPASTPYYNPSSANSNGNHLVDSVGTFGNGTSNADDWNAYTEEQQRRMARKWWRRLLVKKVIVTLIVPGAGVGILAGLYAWRHAMVEDAAATEAIVAQRDTHGRQWFRVAGRVIASSRLEDWLRSIRVEE